MNPYLEKIYNNITADLAKSMFQILQDYPGHEPEVCRLMTAQLGSFIAVSAKDPKEALMFYAARLANFDYEQVRSDYFANTLGVNNTRPAKKLAVVSTEKPLSEAKHDARSSDRQTEGSSGDPLAQKPS